MEASWYRKYQKKRRIDYFNAEMVDPATFIMHKEDVA